MTAAPIDHDHVAYLLALADDALVLGHRLSEWSSRAPTLEEDIALSNIALDLIGQARGVYQHASRIENKGRDEDALAFLRGPGEFRNVLLVEQPNGDFAATMARQLFYSAFAEPHWTALVRSKDVELAGIAAKAAKECAYHLRHASEWVIRLGDGTVESKRRMQAGIDTMWPWTGELLRSDTVQADLVAAEIAIDPAILSDCWRATVTDVLTEATLMLPTVNPTELGGRRGRHTAHLATLLFEMQTLPRAHPGATW
jgi:ring-1,2-phenylacetyl-CoA epoxidase subunit PaaC